MHEGAGPYEARVITCEMAAENICALKLDFPPGITQRACPGQFAEILIPDDDGYHQLRRPFSVAGLRPGDTGALFYFRIQGAGTKRLAKSKSGDILSVLFPLGRGFTPPGPHERIWAVGGGTGVAAVLPLQDIQDADITCFFGFRSRDEMFLPDGMKENVRLAFDTEGITAVDLVRQELEISAPPARIVACGPFPMYRALARISSGIPTEISLEERMGCGTGGCQACVVRVSGKFVRTCTDGPVFPLEEVDEIAG